MGLLIHAAPDLAFSFSNVVDIGVPMPPKFSSCIVMSPLQLCIARLQLFNARLKTACVCVLFACASRQLACTTQGNMFSLVVFISLALQQLLEQPPNLQDELGAQLNRQDELEQQLNLLDELEEPNLQGARA